MYRFMLFVLLLIAAGCRQGNEYPNRPITLVCPWAAGGGTDRVSRQLAAYLEAELGEPVNVINATGGKGVTGHSRGLLARPDGYTITMATLELNMMHWSGLTRLTYRDCIPVMSVNEDYAALFVRQDAPWRDLAELESAIRGAPGKLKASGTASGGAWHLALAGWLMHEEIPVADVTWISSTGAGPSLQELMSGGLDMVCCSLPEANHLLMAEEIRCLGVMAPKRAAGYESVPTFAELGATWELGGWRGVALPVGTPADVVDRLAAALERIVTGQVAIEMREVDASGQERLRKRTFPEFMQAERFDNTSRGPAEFTQFLIASDEKFGKLLTAESMASVNADRFHPLLYPAVIGGLLAVIGVGLVATQFRRSAGSEGGRELATARDASRYRSAANFALIVVAIVSYAMLAETTGFLIVTAALLAAMLLAFGTRMVTTCAIVLGFTPAVYYLFAHLLRVPLPHGWWGW